MLALVFPLTSGTGAFTAQAVLYLLPVSIAACLCSRFITHACAAWLAKRFRGPRDLIIVGSGPRAANLCARLEEANPSDRRILGFVDSPNGHVVPGKIRNRMLGRLDELEGILMRHPVDEVLIALPAKSCYQQIQTTIQTCERAGVEAKYLFDIFELSIAKPKVERDEKTSVVSLKVVRDGYRLIVKRWIDIAGALAGLIVLGPLMLLIAAVIRLTSHGPALFTQERSGFHKRPFRMYKFRTMVVDAEKLQGALESKNEAQGPVFKMRKDPRITPLGRLLRKASLDELPQFFNVLRGDMSLVGPRPLPKRDVSRFDNASLMRRFSVKPGLTCLWQVNGRSDTDFDQWMALDLKYIDEWSLELDFQIIAKTVPSVLKGKGAV
jgi:exopolysaccharide biosynthesis polyprenyl glycosylphosphotransferase